MIDSACTCGPGTYGPVVSTRVGPSNATMTAALYIYRQAFILNSDFGYASALSYVIVAIAGILAFIQIRLLGRRD